MVSNAEYSNELLFQMLDRIKERPGMWLCTHSISTLNTYIDGYQNALMDLEVYGAKPKTVLFPLDFRFMHEFSKIKTNSYGSSSGWANMILEQCDGNQELALKRFFEYLDEFRSLKAVSMKKAVLTNENTLANDNMLYSYRIGKQIDKSQEDITDDKQLYFRSGDFMARKSPIYDSPQAVYIIELSHSNGFLCAVETASDIQLKRYIFSKDQIFGDSKCLESPEHVFGKLTTLVDVFCPENPNFNKPIR